MTQYKALVISSGLPKMGGPMQVREAISSDADRIAEIHVASWRVAYRGQIPDAILAGLNLKKRAAFWEARLMNRPHGIFVVESNEAAVGFCDLIPSRDHDSDPKATAEIAAIYVHPDYWRKGAGAALCRRALDAAKARHFTVVTLWVLASNTAAQDFYKSMGFRPDETTKMDRSFEDFEMQEVRFRISL